MGTKSCIAGGMVIVVRNVSGLDTPPLGSAARRLLPNSASDVGRMSGVEELYSVDGKAGGWLYGAVSYTHLTLPTNREV